MAELRIPLSLLSTALQEKSTKLLRLFAAAKLEGHRSELQPLYECLKIHPKTGSRLTKKIVAMGWAGTDGLFLFPRSWRHLHASKRQGLYITKVPLDLKRFEALAFAVGLKRIYRKQGSPHSKQGRVKQEDFPTGYLASALGLKERRFKALKAAAQRYKYISVRAHFKIIGRAEEYQQLKKNIHGVPVFKRGKHCVVPDISTLKVLV